MYNTIAISLTATVLSKICRYTINAGYASLLEGMRVIRIYDLDRLKKKIANSKNLAMSCCKRIHFHGQPHLQLRCLRKANTFYVKRSSSFVKCFPNLSRGYINLWKALSFNVLQNYRASRSLFHIPQVAAYLWIEENKLWLGS